MSNKVYATYLTPSRKSFISTLRGLLSSRMGVGLSWVIILGLGLLTLSGRYQWTSDSNNSLIGFVCSGYYFVILTPVIYYLIRYISKSTIFSAITTGMWWIISTLPYTWLRLEKFFYPLETLYPQDEFIEHINPAISSPDWFPDAFHNLPAIPQEKYLFGLLILVGVVFAVYILLKTDSSHRNVLLAGVLGYGLILVETWLHLSYRSPYVYITHFEKDPALNFWFVTHLFPGGKGAVNLDYPFFRSIELLFMGKPYISDMMFRRSLFFYISSQFSYFINSFYVCLVINIFTWLSAVFCGYLFTKRYWPERVALLTAGLIATAPGFIMFVAQPMNYLSGYAIIIILMYLFQRLVIEDKTPSGTLLFAFILGLASLIYDLFPFYFLIVAFCILLRVKWKQIFEIIAITLIVYAGPLVLYTRLLGQTIADNNSSLGVSAVTGLMDLLNNGSLSRWFQLSYEYFAQYFLNLGYAFFIFPSILAIIGLAFLKTQKQRWIIFSILIPGALLQALLQFGGSWIYALPRLYFMTYPAIYILASIVLDNLSHCCDAYNLNKVMKAIPWAVLLILMIINNIDVFGNPSQYYHFYWSQSDPWLLPGQDHISLGN